MVPNMEPEIWLWDLEAASGKHLTNGRGATLYGANPYRLLVLKVDGHGKPYFELFNTDDMTKSLLTLQGGYMTTPQATNDGQGALMAEFAGFGRPEFRILALDMEEPKVKIIADIKCNN